MNSKGEWTYDNKMSFKQVFIQEIIYLDEDTVSNHSTPYWSWQCSLTWAFALHAEGWVFESQSQQT